MKSARWDCLTTSLWMENWSRAHVKAHGACRGKGLCELLVRAGAETHRWARGACCRHTFSSTWGVRIFLKAWYAQGTTVVA